MRASPLLALRAARGIPSGRFSASPVRPRSNGSGATASRPPLSISDVERPISDLNWAAPAMTSRALHEIDPFGPASRRSHLTLGALRECGLSYVKLRISVIR